MLRRFTFCIELRGLCHSAFARPHNLYANHGRYRASRNRSYSPRGFQFLYYLVHVVFSYRYLRPNPHLRSPGGTPLGNRSFIAASILVIRFSGFGWVLKNSTDRDPEAALRIFITSIIALGS